VDPRRRRDRAASPEALVIATRRGLAVLAAIAIVLIAVLVLDLTRSRGPTDRTLVPGFDEASVVRMQWTAHPVGPYLTLERAPSAAKNGPWKRTAPTPGAVEQAPIASLLATLRGARWHRSEARDPREDSVANLAIEYAGKHLELWIGRPIENSEQAWIGIGDRKFLVDAWVARALVPSPLDLAVKTPFAGIANVDRYTIDGITISGRPRRMIAPGAQDRTFLVDPAISDAIERALSELAIESMSSAPIAHDNAIAISMAGTHASLGGECEQRVYLAASTGDGCVAREKSDAVRLLVEKLHRPVAELAARAPVPVGIDRVLWRAPPPSGLHRATLDLAKRPMLDFKPADESAVAALMTVLRSPVDPADVVPAPTTKPIDVFDLDVGAEKLQLELHPGNLVHRDDEPIALRLSPEAFAILSRDPMTLVDQTPWREEPTTVDEITIDHVTWKRGGVLGEWVRTQAGASDPASIERLVTLLAQPRVLGVASAPVVGGRTITLVVRPPVGDPISHTLVLGTAIAAGCPAQIDHANLLLPVEICRLVPR
jgi:hypothetical protein